MKTSVERIDDTKVKLTVTVEADRVREAVESAARRLAQDVRIPGFRPGRVPRKVLESRLGKGAVAQEAARESVPGFYTEAAEAEQLAVVGPPEFDVDVFEDGRDAEFSATVEIRPEFEVPDYRGLQVPHPEWEVTEEEVDRELDQLRERFAELETVHRPVMAGDHVRITVTGSRHGERVDAASADDLLYEVKEVEDDDEHGSALDRHLIGAQPGAILKFNDTLGPDYGDLAGTELSFTTIVKEVKAKRLPDLDDDFAITASEFDTIEELRADTRARLAERKLALARQALRGRVVEAVTQLVDIPLPEALVRNELHFRIGQVSQQAEQYGMSFEQFLEAAGLTTEELLSRFEAEARETVKAQLVIDAIGRDAGIEIHQADLGEEVTRQAARLGEDPRELAEFMTQPERLGALVGDVLRRKTVDHVLEHVEVLSGPPEDAAAAGVDTGPDPAADEGGEPAAGGQ